MRLLALDPSITRSGWCRVDTAAPAVRVNTITPRGNGLQRLGQIRDRVLELAAEVDAVVIEDYAYGVNTRQSSVVTLGELGGVLRLALFEAGIPWGAVSISAIKKYATGKGTAKKEEVLAQAIRRFNYGGSDHNEADALALAAAVCDRLGHPLWRVPETHRSTLHRIKLPDAVLAACA